MDIFESIIKYAIVMKILSIIVIIAIITIAINSIIISSRLKKIQYKLIEIDYNNKQDVSQISNEIRKLKP